NSLDEPVIATRKIRVEGGRIWLGRYATMRELLLFSPLIRPFSCIPSGVSRARGGGELATQPLMMLKVSHCPDEVLIHRLGDVFDRTYMPAPSLDDGTASVPAGTLSTSGSWLSFWTDKSPAVYCLYRVIVACDNSWLALRSTVCSSTWTWP